MKRPWQVWLVFVVCVAGAAAAMAWLTQQALRSDELRRAAEAERELEQRVSLALWRMDTELAPIIAEEVIRPPGAYRVKSGFAANGPAQQQPPQVEQQPAQQAGAPSAPAVPPATLPEYVLLQCEVLPDGSWHSPQVPDAEASARLAELSDAVNVPQLLAKLPSTPLPTVADVGRNIEATKSAQSLEEFNRLENQLQFLEGNGANAIQKPEAPDQSEQLARGKVALGKGKVPQITKAADFEQRNLRYQSAAQKGLLDQQRARGINAPPLDDENQFGGGDESPAEEQIGISRPVWVGDRLLLARRVGWNGETVVQGSWLDWPHLKTRLLAKTVDLLPEADLVAVPDDATADPGRMLAGLPVRLVVGPGSMESLAGVLSPTLRWALWMGWGALALAAAAAAALLGGVMALSERRAAFVSSVTHELRTPLTTFRMYSEMLAREMVPDAARRQEYLDTLQREAERLTLLVENVLAYARLERGRRPQAIDRVTVAGLVERIGPRLAQRAAEADMECKIDIDPTVGPTEIATDANVVEQVLFNLVDNAAKYAASATDRRIHVTAVRDGRWVQFAVSDHGPGIDRQRWSRGMQAFGKSAQESAETAPGVGLGLALCRRLARELGGRLDVTATQGGGATVMLRLPVS